MITESRPAGETHAHRLKRLRMRSWRRGMKEMDLLLGRFADGDLANLNADALDAYEALLTENDQDLYIWVSGQKAAPEGHARMIHLLRDFHKIT